MKTKNAAYTPWLALGGALTVPLLYRLLSPPPADEDKKKKRDRLVKYMLAAGMGALGGGLLGAKLDREARERAIKILSEEQGGLASILPNISKGLSDISPVSTSSVGTAALIYGLLKWLGASKALSAIGGIGGSAYLHSPAHERYKATEWAKGTLRY